MALCCCQFSCGRPSAAPVFGSGWLGVPCCLRCCGLTRHARCALPTQRGKRATPLCLITWLQKSKLTEQSLPAELTAMGEQQTTHWGSSVALACCGPRSSRSLAVPSPLGPACCSSAAARATASAPGGPAVSSSPPGCCCLCCRGGRSRRGRRGCWCCACCCCACWCALPSRLWYAPPPAYPSYGSHPGCASAPP